VSAPPASDASRSQVSLALLELAEGGPGRPRLRITRALPAWMTVDGALTEARARAGRAPARRFQLVVLAPAARLLWDSHAPS
jgi:hypothetical protein